MSSTASPALGLETTGRVEAPDTLRRIVHGVWRFVSFFWKYSLGMLLCLNPIGSVIVVGWVYRLVQRSVFIRWWSMRPASQSEVSLVAFLESDSRTSGRLTWPNWVVKQDFLSAVTLDAGSKGWFRSIVTALPHSLWLNCRIGVQGLFNTLVLTLPACALWLFAWYDGWNNSFNKGYEQAAVGPMTGILGIIVFIAVMLYVPMAQVRQAATGRWRSFFQFRVVWSVVRQRWLACLFLAGLYSVLSLPVTILKTAPSFFPQMIPDLHAWSDQQVLAYLWQYFFWATAFVFPAYVVLRLAAARIYAGGLLRAVHQGTLPVDELTKDEREILRRLDLLEMEPTEPRPAWRKVLGWAGSRTGRVVATVAALVVWFSFVAQIFIAEFLCFHPWVGWLNQPLVQAPFFNYIP